VQNLTTSGGHHEAGVLRHEFSLQDHRGTGQVHVGRVGAAADENLIQRQSRRFAHGNDVVGKMRERHERFERR
jgi:hypothetical protein